MANMFPMPLEARTQEIEILRWLNKMQARFAYRFLAKYYDLKNLKILDESVILYGTRKIMWKNYLY